MSRPNGFHIHLATALLLLSSVVESPAQQSGPVDPTARRTYQAARAERVPVIDGKLDDACWLETDRLTDFVMINTGLFAEFKTEGYICFDDIAVYIGMNCHLPPGVVPGIEAGGEPKRPHDSYIFSDDIVEFMIDPGRSTMEYYQLALNAYGSTFDCLRRYGGAQIDASWNGDWEHAVQIVEGSVFGSGPDMAFMQQVLDAGWPFAWYVYLSEKESEARVEDLIHYSFVKSAIGLNREVPNSLLQAIAQPGYMSHIPEGHFLDVDPASSFKVHMQLQFSTLANHPEFFGLYGSLWYYSPYVSEEYARWGAALFRHYGIEGRTKKLTGDPYRLSHISNPDFSEGTSGWTVAPAEEGSIRVDSHIGYGFLQGRFASGSRGDRFVVLRRSTDANRLQQQIENLTPGRLYSLKMISADYADIVAERSIEKATALAITLDDVELLEQHDQTYPSHYGSVLGKFNKDYPAYLSYHFRLFRAKQTAAMLTITGGGYASDPGTSIGREQMLNFVQIEPCSSEQPALPPGYSTA